MTQPIETRAEHGNSPFKGRGSLTQVVEELKRQTDPANFNDFCASTADMAIDFAPPTTKGGEPQILLRPANNNLRDFLPQSGLPLLNQTVAQIAQRLPIEPGGCPVKFFRSALESHPTRWCDFVNGVMKDAPINRLVRCLDGRVRAFLSDSYRVIDTLGVTRQALGIIKDLDGRVLEASVSDSHVKIKIIATDVWNQLETVRTTRPKSEWYAAGLGSQAALSRVSARSRDDLLPLTNKMNEQGGDATVWPSATISNSPTGHGGLNFDGGILAGICFNLATVEKIMRRVHLGQRIETGIYKRDTVMAEAEAIHLKLRDNLTSWFDQQRFAEVCAQVEGAESKKIDKPTAAVNLVVKLSDVLTEDDTDGILEAFMSCDSRSVAGLGQAVARHSQDIADGDRAADVEWLAGELLLDKHSSALAEALV